MNYYIQRDENNTVQHWSIKRLPFEPKGWLKEMREDLKVELKKMHSFQDHVLYGYYQSGTNDIGYDIENILFYNVGSSAFSHLKINDICFEKGSKVISAAPVDLIDDPSSYSLYQVLPEEELCTYWKKDKIVAYWEEITLPDINKIKDAYTYWAAMKQARIDIHDTNEEIYEYGIELSLYLTRGKKFSLPSESMKKLLDGVICSFHVHDGQNESDILERLAIKLPLDESSISYMLRDNITNVLGERNLFGVYRENSLICNPADDNCVFVRIKVLPSKNDHCFMSGQLFTVNR